MRQELQGSFDSVADSASPPPTTTPSPIQALAGGVDSIKMPTFTAIALDRLLEPGAARGKPIMEPTHVNKEKEVPVRSENGNGCMNGDVINKVVQKKHHWTQISPALYTTPVATPVPDTDTASSFHSSPYIVNHKRRGASLARRSSREIISEMPQVQMTHDDFVDEKAEGCSADKDAILPGADVHLPLYNNADEFLVEKSKVSEVPNGVVGQISPQTIIMASPARDGESDNFFDPRDSLSCSSYSDGEYCSSVKFAYLTGEFYDAPEELSSDSGTPKSWLSPGRDIESELRVTKMDLLAEIEQRKQAEDVLQQLRCRWLKLQEQLSSVGITLPADFPLYPEAEPGNILDVCEQINVARLVSEAVGRGIAKAVAEKEMEEQLESKNFEISRLNDRLHYYEAVNHEMSQRNQEVMESARQFRQQKNQRRQRWVWGSITTGISLGVAALAWTYLPIDKGVFSSHAQEIPKDIDSSGN